MRCNGIHFRPVSYPPRASARYARSVPDDPNDPIRAAIRELRRRLAAVERRLTGTGRRTPRACTIREGERTMVKQ